MKHILSIMAAALLFATPAHAEVKHFTLEKPHTQIFFSVSHMGFSHSTGSFHDFDGTIDYDVETPANSKVDVTIKTNSLDMGTDKWDEHVKGADLLNVAEFPTITFKSTSINVTGEKTAEITGDLTIMGVTKPATLQTTLNKVGEHPMSGKDHAGFSARTIIKRSDFGMEYGIPNVGDDVHIIIEVEAESADVSNE